MSQTIWNWNKFSLREKIAQMIVVRTTGFLFDHQIRYPAWEATSEDLKYWLQELNIGGVILLGGSAAELTLRTQQLQQWARLPLFVAADIEEGVGQRFTGATWFPPPMALGKMAESNLEEAIDFAFSMGRITAQEALSIGINWILAPIVDVNNNPDNPVINIRAFGDRSDVVSKLATAFIKGANSFPVLTTAKHFPGHGDTITDSHLDLPKINHNQTRLNQVELPPFQAAIEAGVDGVMSAHLLIETWDNQNPATLSHHILTEQLREKLNFQGLIVTDALIMGGVAKYSPSNEICVQAIKAGADILLMPSNPLEAIDSVEKAVTSGIISEERINDSLKRIQKAKEKFINSDVNNSQFSDTPTKQTSTNFTSTQEMLTENLAKSQHFEQVKGILRKTTLKGGNLPLNSTNAAKNLIIVDDILNCEFLDKQTPAVIMPENRGYQTQVFDNRTIELIKNNLSNCILQVFIRGNPFRGSAGLSKTTHDIYDYLIENRLIEGLIIYGSPYILDLFRSHLDNTTPWVFSYGQMPLAQAIACQYLLGMSENDDLKKGNFL